MRERSLGLTVAVLLVISTIASTNIFCLRYDTEVNAALTHAHMLGDCTVRHTSNDAAPRVVDKLSTHKYEPSPRSLLLLHPEKVWVIRAVVYISIPPDPCLRSVSYSTRGLLLSFAIICHDSLTPAKVLLAH